MNKDYHSIFNNSTIFFSDAQRPATFPCKQGRQVSFLVQLIRRLSFPTYELFMSGGRNLVFAMTDNEPPYVTV